MIAIAITAVFDAAAQLCRGDGGVKVVASFTATDLGDPALRLGRFSSVPPFRSA